MTTLALAWIILIEILTWLVVFDVILSWLAMAWIKRPQFIWSVLDPMYKWIKAYIPTVIWPFELTPIVLIILLAFAAWIIKILVPWVELEIMRLSN